MNLFRSYLQLRAKLIFTYFRDTILAACSYVLNTEHDPFHDFCTGLDGLNILFGPALSFCHILLFLPLFPRL